MTAEITPFSTSRFTYNPQTKTLIAEASDLGLNTIPYHLHIRSERTGKTVRFFLAETRRDVEGEVTSWLYRSIDSNGATVLLFND